MRPDGRLDLDWLEAACRRPGRALLALQGANNETGVVQPVAEAAALVHAAGGLVFCDAVQMAGRMDCGIAALGADALMLSAHKIGRNEGRRRAWRRRAPGSAWARRWCGAAARSAALGRAPKPSRRSRASAPPRARASPRRRAKAARLAGLRDRLAEAVRSVATDAVIFSEAAPRLPNTVCFAAPGVEAATLMIALDLAGVAVSSGSACSSGKVAPSHVLAAMGVKPELARGAIRLSLGWASAEADVDRFAEAFRSVMARMRTARRARARVSAWAVSPRRSRTAIFAGIRSARSFPG